MTSSTSARYSRRSIVSGLGIAALVPSAALAQFMPTADRFRLMDLMGGEFAIQTSRLALERSRAQHIREFAQIEIQEQTDIAASLGGVPGTTPIRRDQAAIVQRLSSMAPGARFDRAYIAGQIEGHRELLALNSNYANSGPDPLARSVAQSSLPLIQAHLAWLTRRA